MRDLQSSNQLKNEPPPRVNGWTILGFSLIGVGIFAYAFLFLFGLASALSVVPENAENIGVFVMFGFIFGFPIVGVGILIVKVILDRLGNKEDDYYSKNVEL